jgi:hypothetical protein
MDCRRNEDVTLGKHQPLSVDCNPLKLTNRREIGFEFHFSWMFGTTFGCCRVSLAIFAIFAIFAFLRWCSITA